jgi:hypothetical protein
LSSLKISFIVRSVHFIYLNVNFNLSSCKTWRVRGLRIASPRGIQDVWSPSPPGVFYLSTTRPMLPNSRFHGASLRLEVKGRSWRPVLIGWIGQCCPHSIGIWRLPIDLIRLLERRD